MGWKVYWFKYARVIYLFMIVVIYIVCFCVGFFVQSDNEIITIKDKSNQYIGMLTDNGPFLNSLYILKNNLAVVTKIFGFGLFSFGLFSIVYIGINGLMHGSVIGLGRKHLPYREILEYSLPHSYELIGLFIAGYAGFALSNKILLNIEEISYKKVAILMAIAYLIIISSAFVEGYISIG